MDQTQCAILVPDKETETFFETFDKMTIKFLTTSSVIKKYGLKNFSYKTLINEIDGLDKHVLRTRIYNEKKPTLFFSSKKSKFEQ